MFGLGDMVSWKDYEGLSGFEGSASSGDIDDLHKALSAGQDIDAPGAAVAGDGFALRVESLERTLRITTYRMSHLRMWVNVPKTGAFNTIEEHNELSSYGENQDSGFVGEGDLPEEDDSTYERKYSIVKFLGSTRRVTHVMSIVKPAHSNVVSQETVNGTMHLLKILERAMFYGDSNLSALQFDGWERLMLDKSPAANIIDMRGLPLSEDVLTDVCLTVQDAPNYGQVSHCYLNPKVKADLVKTFFPKERHDTLQKTSTGMVGLDIKGFESPAGPVLFEPSVFVDDGGPPVVAGVGDPLKRPAVPTITTAVDTPAAGASQFGADDEGDYWYQIVAVNRYGRSAPVAAAGGAVAVVAGDKMTVGVTPGSATTVNYYILYRSKKDGASGTERQILRIPNAAGAGEQFLDDFNNSLPETTSAFMFQMDADSMGFKQLAPMVKIPLATIDASIRWMQLIYGVNVLYAPKRHALIRNVGRSSGYVGAP